MFCGVFFLNKNINVEVKEEGLELDRKALWAASMHKVVTIERKETRKRHFDKYLFDFKSNFCEIVV